MSLVENSVESIKGYDINKRRWKDEQIIVESRRESGKARPEIRVVNEDPTPAANGRRPAEDWRPPTPPKPRSPPLDAIDLSVIESVPREGDGHLASS